MRTIRLIGRKEFILQKSRSYETAIGFIPEGEDNPDFYPHPDMDRLKKGLDKKMTEIEDIESLKLGHFTSQGGDLIKKYWIVDKLSKSLSVDGDVTKEDLLNFKEKINKNSESLLKNTGGAGLSLNLTKKQARLFFAFFETIGRLVKSIFEKTHSQRFVDGITNVSVESPEGKDFRYPCLKNEDGDYATSYRIGKIYSN